MGLQASVIYFGCLIVAVILHEMSHGIVALFFGDDTAKKAGRLTLNPLPHLDPFGSVILPAFGAITGIPVIAWAKPVPVNPNQMRHPRRDMLWVGLVGPFTNFALMFAAAWVARSLFRNITIFPGDTLSDLPVSFQIAYYFALVEPVPRHLQPAADPAPGRLVAARADPPRGLVAALVPIPPVRHAPALRAGVLHADPGQDHRPVRDRPLAVHHPMKATHLVRRFFGALWPGRPRAEDEAWAGEVLDPEELLLFRRLPNHDRRHALRVARRVDDTLGPGTDTRWLAAAMLHDVGKYDSGLSVPGRALATVAASAPGGVRRLQRWEQRRGWRRHMALYARHGELGADQIRRAGGREEAAVWSAAHHHPETFTTIPIPDEVVRVLDAADQ